MGAIADGVSRGFQGLRGLHVGENPLGDSGLAELARALPPTLHALYIEHTRCSDSGMAAIAAAMQQMPELEEFDCAKNPDVGPEGWGSLGAALATLPALRELQLSQCRGLGCDGMHALWQTLPRALAPPRARCRRYQAAPE